jgi:glycosyltransferase involved in cell wall biosynthesis
MATAVSLVVCTLGRVEPLVRLFASLRAQSHRDFEVVLVDQNEPGFLARVLAAFNDLPLRYIRSEHGLSKGRNRALAVCASPIVGFPDDDCWYPPDFIASLVRRFEQHPNVSVLTGRTVDAKGRNSVSRHLATSQQVSRATVFLAGNSNTIFVRGDSLAKVGGFDETLGAGAGTPYGSGEETDFLLRCLDEGLVVRFDHDLVVRHDQVREAADHGRVRTYSAGYGRVVRVHGLGLLSVAKPVARASARALQLVGSGDLQGARAKWAWVSGCVAGYLASRRDHHDRAHGG